MPAILFREVNGKEGSVRIPALGVVIGRMASWTMKRRGDDGPGEGSYDLRAVLSYANPVLFNHAEWADKRDIRVTIGRNVYRLEETGGSLKLEGMTLTVEGVKLAHP